MLLDKSCSSLLMQPALELWLVRHLVQNRDPWQNPTWIKPLQNLHLLGVIRLDLRYSQ